MFPKEGEKNEEVKTLSFQGNRKREKVGRKKGRGRAPLSPNQQKEKGEDGLFLLK